MRKKKFTRTVGVLLNEDTYQQLVDVTDKHQVTMSEYLRDLVEKKLKHSKEKKEND